MKSDIYEKIKTEEIKKINKEKQRLEREKLIERAKRDARRSSMSFFERIKEAIRPIVTTIKKIDMDKFEAHVCGTPRK